MIPLIGTNEYGKDPYEYHFVGCKYMPKMCRYCKNTTFKAFEIDLHEKNCEYKTYNCPECTEPIFEKDKEKEHSCINYLIKRVKILKERTKV